MDRLKVAVVDSGIEPAHPAVAKVTFGARLAQGANGTMEVGDDFHDVTGHGTACAGIISQNLHARIEILPVRVVDENGTSTCRLVEEAIVWAVDHGARVINISLGAPEWQDDAYERLRAVVAAAVQRGTVIVAAAGPEGVRALPAVLDEVITVGSAVCPPGTLYVADEGHLDFLAKGDLQRVAWTNGTTILGQGTSLAAAHVTNAVCRLLLAHPKLDAAAVRAALAASSVQSSAGFRAERRARVEAFYRSRSPERVRFLDRVALYPFNKEVHSLVRFRDTLPFTIAAVADPPGKRLSGRDAGEVLGEPHAGLPILPSFERALEVADSVILGHLEALTGRASPPLLATLIRKAVEQDKGVYSFSRLSGPGLAEVRALAERRGVPLVDPTVSRADLAAILHLDEEPQSAVENPLRDPRLLAHGRVFRRNLSEALVHDCPVLGVFGTSRAQGKFSLQIALKALLAKMGYRISHLATEPTGMLVGSTTLPTGYERGNDLGIEETSFLTHVLLTEMKNRERPDLLLVGGQSSVITLGAELYRFGLGSLATLGFAAAAQPDACILVCNPFDPKEHVLRCRAALEAVVQSPVIAAAFGDQVTEDYEWRGVRRRRQARLDEGALRDRLQGWEKTLGVPCGGVLSAEGQARLGRAVVDHFASAAPAEAGSPAIAAG
ncbi:serine protease [Minicystis rosea]|nr:serine protease [Minicystis rosea]